MKFMRNIVETTKHEIFFQMKSKCIIYIILLLTIITIIHMFGLYNSVLNNYQMYNHTKQLYIENGIDIIEALKDDNIVYANQNSSITNNPIKEDYINLAISIQNVLPMNAISNTYEYFLFVFGTLIFGIYSAYIAAYDFKFRTYKIISTMYSQNEILLGKICSIFILIFVSMVFMAALAWGFSYPVKFLISNKLPINEYLIPGLKYTNSILEQFIFAVAILVLYTIIGFSISYITKNMLPVTLILSLYTLLIPTLGAYDLKNIISYFAHKVFDFQSRFVIFEPVEISSFWGAVILVSIVTFLLILVKIISLNRSKYN